MEYAPPVLRAPSPASSVGTAYGPDQTALSDTEAELFQAAFESKWTDRLGLGVSGQQEDKANADPLLSVPTNLAEEKVMHQDIMQSLRLRVQQLEENELFEQTLLRGSQAALEQQPVSNNISTLMRGMMSITNGSKNDTNGANISNGPWNANSSLNRSNYVKIGTVDVTQESGNTTGRTASGIKGKGRSRKA